MRRKNPLPERVYKAMYPQFERGATPTSWSSTVKALREETITDIGMFYGAEWREHLESRYAGLDYNAAHIRRRLSRWPVHERLFFALDALGLTPGEVENLCDWDGTLRARRRYETEHGIVVRDTTGDCVARESTGYVPEEDEEDEYYEEDECGEEYDELDDGEACEEDDDECEDGEMEEDDEEEDDEDLAEKDDEEDDRAHRRVHLPPPPPTDGALTLHSFAIENQAFSGGSSFSSEWESWVATQGLGSSTAAVLAGSSVNVGASRPAFRNAATSNNAVQIHLPHPAQQYRGGRYGAAPDSHEREGAAAAEQALRRVAEARRAATQVLGPRDADYSSSGAHAFRASCIDDVCMGG